MKTPIQFTYPAIWKMAYPILISMLMQQLVGITDVIYMGRLSETALGASALGSTYFFTVFMVSFGFSIGAQIIMARRNGENAHAKIGEVFYQGCAFLTAASAAFILFSQFFSPFLLEKIIENKNTYAATVEYTNWRMPGLICASLMMMGRAFFVAITSTYVLTVVSILMVLSNICLNYILIFGKYGFPAMGIAGAALASDLAEIIAVSVYVTYFLYKIDLKKYGLTKFVFANFKLLKSILSVSIWTMLQQFISVSTWFLFFVAIEHLSERALAVSNLLRSLSSFPYVVINAMAAVMSSATSNLIGAGQSREVLPVAARIMKLCTVLVIPLLIGMALFIRPLLHIYTDNSALIADSVPAGMVMLTSFLPLIPAWILFNAVSGTGNTRYAMNIELVAMVAYVFHISLVIFTLKMPLPVCWTADWVYNLVILYASYRYMHSLKWQNRRI